jgi:hypothetical protein
MIERYRDILVKLLLVGYVVFLLAYAGVYGKNRKIFGIFMGSFCFLIMIAFVYLAVEIHRRSTERIKNKLKTESFQKYKKILQDNK